MSASRRQQTRLLEKSYFTVATTLFGVLVLIAFAPTFFQHSAFHNPAPTPFIAFHGVLMTGWMVLLAVQALLVWLGCTGWHKRLGYAAAGYAALIVSVGCMTTLASAAREIHAHSRIVNFQLNVLGLEIVQMFLFGSFTAAGIILRTRTDWHKRLIVLATLCIMPNVIVRFSFRPTFEFLDSNLLILHAWVLFMLCVAAIDWIHIRKLHPVYRWGMPAAACALYAAWAVSLSAPWDRFWMKSLS